MEKRWKRVTEMSLLLGTHERNHPTTGRSQDPTNEISPNGNCCKACWSGLLRQISSISYNIIHMLLIGSEKSGTSDEKILKSVFPLGCTLMLTMWSSIFQAAFYAYVHSKNG